MCIVVSKTMNITPTVPDLPILYIHLKRDQIKVKLSWNIGDNFVKHNFANRNSEAVFKISFIQKINHDHDHEFVVFLTLVYAWKPW